MTDVEQVLTDLAPIVLPFTGSRAITAPLTWSQAGIWALHRRLWPDHHYFNFGRLFRVPPGRSLADVGRAVRTLVERHEAFRTTVHRSADGTLEQRVAQVGEYRVRVVDTDRDRVAGVGERLAYDYKGHGFQDDEWPLLVVAITSGGGVPEYVLFMASHLAVDRWGMELACTDFTDLLADSDPPRREPPYQPADLAAVQSGTAGLRLARRAVDYWRRTLETVPQNQFPWPPASADARWCPSAVLTSRALDLAARVLAERRGGTAPGAVLAAVAGLLAVRTGTGTAVLRLFASNRYGPDVQTMVGTHVQTALYALDTTGLTLDQLIERSWQAAALAYRHSRYPPDAVDAVTAEIEQRRGIALDLLCHFHDMTGKTPSGLPGATAADIDAALPETSVRRDAVLGRRQQFLVELTGQLGGRLRLSVGADPRFLSLTELRTLVSAVEAILVRAVREDVPLTVAAADAGVSPRERSATAVRIDGCWIEPEAVRETLLAVPDVAAAIVSFMDGEIVGQVTVRGEADVAALHRACVALLVGRRPTAMAPHRYVVRAGSVVVTGTGRE